MDGRRRRRWPYSPAMVEGERGVGGGEVGGLAGPLVDSYISATIRHRRSGLESLSKSKGKLGSS
jgi:hypothetical protein